MQEINRPTNKIPLGTEVVFSSYLKRRELSKGSYKRVKLYDELECRNTKGIFIGTRTLQEGYSVYDAENGWYWKKTRHFEAALIVTHPRKVPMVVLLENVSIANCLEGNPCKKEA